MKLTNFESKIIRMYFAAYGKIRTFWTGILSKMMGDETPYEIDAAGNLPIDDYHIFLVTPPAAGTIAPVLPDPEHGKAKRVLFVATSGAGGDCDITPTSFASGANTLLRFNAAEEAAELCFMNGNWYVVNLYNATLH
jgi:flavoprotein